MGTNVGRGICAVTWVALAWMTSCQGEVQPGEATPRPPAADPSPQREAVAAFRADASGYVTSGPVADGPVASRPVAGRPVASRPVASRPVASRPAWSARVTHPGAVELAASHLPALFRVSTVTLGRDAPWRATSCSAELTESSPQASANSVVIVRGAATEVITRHARGLEQAWRFDEAPPGHGPLLVELAQDGADFRARDGAGLHFVDPKSGARFRYGVATWVDARGQRTPVETSASAGSIHIRVPEPLLASSHYPAWLDPTIEVETVLDPASLYVRAPMAQRSPDSASDGVDGLVVWSDDRDAPFEVFGTGVMATGVAHQRANVRLSGSGALDAHVAYLDSDSGGNRRFVLVVSNQFDLDAVTITMAPNGEVTAAPPVNIFTPPPGVFTGVLDVAASPTDGEYLVLFHTGNSGGVNAQAATFDFDHQPVAGPVQLFPIAYPVGYVGSVAFAGDSYIVASRNLQSETLRARILSPALNVLDTLQVTAEANQPSEPRVAFNGTSALIVWIDRRSGEHIWGRRLDSGGFISAEFPVAPSTSDQYAPHVSAGDAASDDFFVAWIDSAPVEDTVAGTTVTAANAVSPVFSSAVARHLHGVSVGGVPLTFFDDAFGNPTPDTADVYAMTFDGAWSAPLRLSEEANRQTDLAIDVNDGVGLAAWTDTRQGTDNTDIDAIAVDDAGAPTGPLIEVARDPAPEGEVDVATGNDGATVVVWRRGDLTPSSSTDTEIWAALVVDGSVVASTLVAAGAVYQFPRVVRDGDAFAITWQSGIFSCEAFCQFFEAEPWIASLTTSGSSLQIGTPVSAGESGLSPHLAPLPSGGVLWTWEHSGDIHAARRVGGVLGPRVVVAQGPGRQSHPTAAVSNSVALIAFEDDSAGGSRIFGVQLTDDDVVSDLGPISGTIASHEPEVVDARDGYSFLVTWDGSAFGAPEQVWGGWIKASGELVDAAPRQLTQNPFGAARHPDVVTVDAGRMLIGFDAVGSERSERAHALVVGSGLEDGQACVAADDCASRFCADLVCCSSSCDGSCQRCGDDGACTAVMSAQDDSCFDDEMCDASGTCRRANGQTCDPTASDPNCASGFCVDNVCCESECAGECDKCGGETPGQCRPQSCGNFGCHADKTCRETCGESRHCLAGFQCVNGDCVTPPELQAVEVGCSCEAAGAQRPNHGGAAWLLLAGAWLGRRRGQRRASRVAQRALREQG